MKIKSDLLKGALLGAFGMAAVGGGVGYFLESNASQAARDASSRELERFALRKYTQEGLTDFTYEDTHYILNYGTVGTPILGREYCALGVYEVRGYDRNGEPNSFKRKPDIAVRVDPSHCTP